MRIIEDESCSVVQEVSESRGACHFCGKSILDFFAHTYDRTIGS